MNRGDEMFVLNGSFTPSRGDSMPGRNTATRFLIPPGMPAAEFCGPAHGSWPRRHRSRPALSRERVVHFSHGGGLYVGRDARIDGRPGSLPGHTQIPRKLVSCLRDHGMPDNTQN